MRNKRSGGVAWLLLVLAVGPSGCSSRTSTPQTETKAQPATSAKSVGGPGATIPAAQPARDPLFGLAGPQLGAQTPKAGARRELVGSRYADRTTATGAAPGDAVAANWPNTYEMHAAVGRTTATAVASQPANSGPSVPSPASPRAPQQTAVPPNDPVGGLELHPLPGRAAGGGNEPASGMLRNPLRDGAGVGGGVRPTESRDGWSAVRQPPPAVADVRSPALPSTAAQGASPAFWAAASPAATAEPVAVVSAGPAPTTAAPSKSAPAAALAAVVETRSDAGQGTGGHAPLGKHPPTRKNSSQKFDPIAENHEFFGGWTPPKLALVFTGRLDGYIEPCGCAGFDRMKGGLSRRATMLAQLEEKGWPLVKLDVGGLNKGFGPQANIKFQRLADAYKTMGYDAVGLGVADLKLPAGELLAAAQGTEKQPSIFTSANVGLFKLQAKMLPTYKVLQAGGKKIGVIAVLGDKERKEINNSEIETADADAAITAILPALRQECNGGYLVLLAYATVKETEDLAQKYRDFHVVVTSDGAEEPPAAPTVVPGTQTVLVGVGEKGMNAVVLGIYDPPQPARYQRVILDSRYPPSRQMQLLMETYQDQLKDLGWEGLGLRPIPHPDQAKLGGYIGSEKCADCHEESYKVWKNSVHAGALATLENAKPPRQSDPECISCHVVGWNPQGHFPFQTGFVSREKTPRLGQVGCESCHGPGQQHAAAEEGSNEPLQKALQKAITVTKEDAAKNLCRQCHDLDNSPEFDFNVYWPYVEHHEDPDKAAKKGK